MSKEQIKTQFKDARISFGVAMSALLELGMTEFAAEQYLYAD